MEPPRATWLDAPPPTGGRRWPTGWHVHVVEETGSTNADLLAAAAAGAPDRTVLVARHQTAGRGRLDRRWDAPPGANLLVSLLFRSVPAHVHELTQRVALAAVAAVRAMGDLDPVLKWPNDVLVVGGRGDEKLAGVLAQAGPLVGGAIDHVVVGIGVNVGWAPEGAARVGDVDPLDLLARMLEELDALPADVGPVYRAALGTLGQQVRIQLPGDQVLEGRAVDVDPDGRLVVLDACAVTHRIDTGDVLRLRPT